MDNLSFYLNITCCQILSTSVGTITLSARVRMCHLPNNSKYLMWVPFLYKLDIFIISTILIQNQWLIMFYFKYFCENLKKISEMLKKRKLCPVCMQNFCTFCFCTENRNLLSDQSHCPTLCTSNRNQKHLYSTFYQLLCA